MSAAPTLKNEIAVISVSVDAVLAFVAMFGLIFTPTLGSSGALLFLMAGCVLMARWIKMCVPLCLRYWFILALPVFCVISAMWSQYPALSFRFGLQFSATVMIAVFIAAVTSARDFARSLFILYSAAIVASAVFGDVRGDTGAWLGIYGSKNALAGAAAIYVIICTAVIFDHKAHPMYRQLAGLGFGLGLMLLLFAQSISALALLPIALMLQISLLVLYTLTPLQRIASMTFLILLMCLAVLIATAQADVLMAVFLDTTGKDVTLTGRTDLWRVAMDYISQRPFLGVGYQAFWVKDNNTAEALWHAFGIDSRSGFNFHNTYLSNAVEIGLIGVAMQVFLLYGAACLTGLWAIKTHRADAALLFVLVMMVVMISFVEVPVFFQFSLRSVIVICAFVYALRGLRENQDAV